jgi:hypothetical protein
MAFDASNRLYVLDGRGPVGMDGVVHAANLLVQTFDASGTFQGQFSVADAALPSGGDPARIAVDSGGNIYVTQPAAGYLAQYGPNGQLLWKLAYAGAGVLAVRAVGGQERILLGVMGADQTTAQLAVIRPDGEIETTIPLSHPVKNCMKLTTDQSGNLYLQADLNQIYRYDANGSLLDVIGAGTNRRMTDGSELLDTVAVDAQGGILSITPGNPGMITRFSSDLMTFTQCTAQFSWTDAWDYNPLYGQTFTPFAIDGRNRLWVGVNGWMAPGGAYHSRPCVLRTVSGIVSPGTPGITPVSTLLLGFSPIVQTTLYDDIAYDLSPLSVDFVVQAAYRRLKNVSVQYTVYDVYKRAAGSGSFTLALSDAQEARARVSFTPPAFGWYTLEFQISDGNGQWLMGIGKHVGVTPHFAGMPDMTVDSLDNGDGDAARQRFAGLMLMRSCTYYGLDALNSDVARAQARNLTLIAQFTNVADCVPPAVRAAVTRFAGRVKFWEVVNEPDLRMTPQQYITILKKVYPLIKQLDPNAQVLAPAISSVNLNWLRSFYDLGGKNYCDALTVHDYEGNESIDPGYWRTKFGALRQLMAQYGDADKPVWQTERAIPAVRANTFQGGCQAVRVTLHYDILETLGIPGAHNLHFYMSDHGFSQVPSYLWSAAGPHPAALAVRTRTAMILGRRYTGTLDFGPTGNKLLLGLRYTGASGDTVTLRNLGAADLTFDFGATGSTVDGVDSFGNSFTIPVVKGHASITIPSLPIYLRLSPGQKVAPIRVDFGHNMAAEATFTYDGTSGGAELLTNGILETNHIDDPFNGRYWWGEMLAVAQADETAPEAPTHTLQIAFPTARPISHMIVYSLRADNPYCTLLDYDVEGCNNGQWSTLAQIRTDCPDSDPVQTPQSAINSWYMDQNMNVVTFPTINTNQLRLVILRATYGFAPDSLALNAARDAFGIHNPMTAMLREIEIY